MPVFFALITTTEETQQFRAIETCGKAPNVPFCDFELVDLIADGLQVALLGETRQQSLHTAVELLLAIKLRREMKSKLKQEDGKESGRCDRMLQIHKPHSVLGFKQSLVQFSFTMSEIMEPVFLLFSAELKSRRHFGGMNGVFHLQTEEYIFACQV